MAWRRMVRSLLAVWFWAFVSYSVGYTLVCGVLAIGDEFCCPTHCEANP